MNTLSNELKGVIARHLERASSRDVLTIASALCVEPEPVKDFAAPAPRFTMLESGMVRDNTTGLIWSRGHVSDERLEWKQAQQACTDFRLGGHSDWRLPTIRELLSIVDYERHDPAIDPVFECKNAWYWSSTPDCESPSGCAWSVDFSYGSSSRDSQSYDGFVRAVRVGQF